MHACNHSIDDTGEWRTSPAISFLVSDYFVTWGKRHSAHLAQGPGSPGEVWEVGCLWSEHAKRTREDPRLREIFERQLRRHWRGDLERVSRVVGFFDTSISAMLTAHDLRAFYQALLRLARALPDVLFVAKPKYPLEETLGASGAAGLQLLAELRETPNVALLSNLFDTGAAVGLSDLCISACFTSTGAESLGCGTRSLYYDPTKRFPHAFWTRIPGLVVGDTELLERVRHLLWECNDEQYLAYLREHFTDIDGYFDGRAITRLRERLVGLITDHLSVTGRSGG
jgi:polysaccharide biosynthesis PFTS motif protein